MLAIRMQRIGRKGRAHFRVLVQDSRQSPKSGKFVALLGSYDPHAKTSTLNKEKAQEYVKNGARPSERVAQLLKKEGVKLPKWVETPSKKNKTTKNAEKLRKNQPAQPKVAKDEAAPTPAQATEQPQAEVPEQAQDKDASSEPAKEEDKTKEANVKEPEQEPAQAVVPEQTSS